MPNREITPAQAFGVLIQRIDRRKEILSRMGNEITYNVVLAELDVVRFQLVKAQQYFTARHTETKGREMGRK